MCLHSHPFRALYVALLLAVIPPDPATAAMISPAIADFGDTPASIDAHRVADWVVSSSDSRGLPFIIVDKLGARLFLFEGGGILRATSPVLLGLGRGDDTPPGVGDRPLSQILPAERITPAGRFVAEQGHNLSGKDILWIDYDAAISLHRATDRKPGLTAKSRLDRLNSTTNTDNRISHGCVNVSAAFYDRYIQRTAQAIVYILPETRSAAAEFNLPAARHPATLAGVVRPGA